MRRLAKLVALVVAVGVAQPAYASDRGALSGVGLGFVVLSLMSFGLGIGGLATASDAARTESAFVLPLMEADATAFNKVHDRLVGGATLGVVGLVLGAVSLGASIVCLVVDTPSAKATVSFAPNASGGTFVLSAQF